jgi:hypothetical protein
MYASELRKKSVRSFKLVETVGQIIHPDIKLRVSGAWNDDF